MIEQLDLLAPVHRGDAQESREAAARVQATHQFHLVLQALNDLGCATDDEIAGWAGLLRHSAGTRRGVAVRRGLVERAGSGLSALGNRAATWVLTSAGRAYLNESRAA